MRFPLFGKLSALAAVFLALMAGLGIVAGIVSEREGRLREAQAGVADSLAGAQRLVGPLLQRRCVERWQVEVGEGKLRRTVDERREFWLASTPRTLDIDGQAKLEPRYRGLFKVNGYALAASVTARWADLHALEPKAEHAGSTLACDAPLLVAGVGDARGLRKAELRLQGAVVELRPGTPRRLLPQGLQATVPAAAFDAAQPFEAQLALELVGTESLSLAGTADSTQVQLQSDWPHPSFQGRFLPSEREVTPQGFRARWSLSALATSAPRDLLADGEQLESFGVAFIDPVNPYVLSDRATKYGLLFIGLSFVGVGLVEVLQRRRVHPLQYLLVGCALALFFLLLVSLSEHIAFGSAYAVAAAACTALLGYYGRHVLGSRRAGLVFGGAIAMLYAALYVLLQLEQTALVLGAVLLFAVLAGVMVATRRLDWYALAGQLRGPTGTPAAPPQVFSNPGSEAA